jgi:hypothetical protein
LYPFVSYMRMSFNPRPSIARFLTLQMIALDRTWNKWIVRVLYDTLHHIVIFIKSRLRLVKKEVNTYL